MQNVEATHSDENERKVDVVGDEANHASVIIFTEANYCGAQATWSGTWPYYKIANGDDDTFDGNLGSLIVLRGQCEVTTSIGGVFPAPDNTETYYNANAGLNNQGCFPGLGSNTNRITALRTQRDDIIRPTNTPYLVLRDHPNKITDAKAIVLQGDTPSINAFTCGRAIAVGSTTGEWYLCDQENYQGNYIKVTVGGGTEHNVGNGYYGFDEDFIVRSVTMTHPEADIGSWESYTPNFIKKFHILNSLGQSIQIRNVWTSGSESESTVQDDERVEYYFDFSAGCLTSSGSPLSYISINGESANEDIRMNKDAMTYASFSQGTFDIMRFASHLYLSYVTEPVGFDGTHVPCRFNMYYSQSGEEIIMELVKL